MDAIDNHDSSKTERTVFPALLVANVASAAADLRSMQKYREKSLWQAEKLTQKSWQAGCFSEVSIVENALDDPQFREVLEEIGQLLQTSPELVAALEPLDLRINAAIVTYDESPLGIADLDEDSGIDISEDEIETLGYMAWLAPISES
jgi:hypothetical protein